MTYLRLLSPLRKRLLALCLIVFCLPAQAFLSANTATANLLDNLTGNTALPANQSESSQTLSVISPAQITVTGSGNAETDAQSQAAAGTLTQRDPATANESLTNTLTLQQAQALEADLQDARENREAARVAGQVLTQMVGDIAQANHWKEGSPQKLALHGLAGLIEAKLGDGSIAGGILGGVAQELLAGELSAYLKANGFDVNEAGLSKEEREQRQADYDALMTLGATLAGTAAGALADGLEGAAAGAVAAQIGIKNNYLKHDELPRYLAALKKLEECQQTGGACAEEKQAVADWVDISKSRDAEITSCRDTGTCQKWLDEVQNDIALLNASITHIEDLRRDLYAEGNKTGSSALAGTVEVFKDQLADINSVFGAQYQQLFVNARAEYMATHPNASLTDFNERYGYNTTGVIAAVSGITAGWIAGKTSGGPAGNAKPVEGGSSAAEGGGLSIAEQSGILRDAAKGKGNFSLGQATTSEAEALGQAWVGPNYRIASDGKTLVSSDSLRTYRPPSPKDSPYATTGVQANFEQLEIIGGRLKAISNGHLNITP